MHNQTQIIFNGEEVTIEVISEKIKEEVSPESKNTHVTFRVTFKDLKNAKEDFITVLMIHDGERFIIVND
jgi:hypothetical protein